MENSMNAFCFPAKAEGEAASSECLSSMFPESQFASDIASAQDPPVPNFSKIAEISAAQEAVAPQESSAPEEGTRSPIRPKNSIIESLDVLCNPLAQSHPVHQIESLDAQPLNAQETLTHEELLAVDGWHALPLSEEQVNSSLYPVSLTSPVEPMITNSLSSSGEGGLLSNALAEERPRATTGMDWSVSEGLAPSFESIAVDEGIGVKNDVVHIEAGGLATSVLEAMLMKPADEREIPDLGKGESHEHVISADSSAVVGSPVLLRETDFSATTIYTSKSHECTNIMASETVTTEGSHGVGFIQTEASEKSKEFRDTANTCLVDTGDNESFVLGKEMELVGLPPYKVANATSDTLITCGKGEAGEEEVAVHLSLQHMEDDVVNDTYQEDGVDTEVKIVESIDTRQGGHNPVLKDSIGIDKFQEADFELKGAEFNRETETEKDSTLCSAVLTTGASEKLKSEEDAVYVIAQSQDMEMIEQDTEMPSPKSESGLEMEQPELHTDLLFDSNMLLGYDVSPEQQQQPRKRGRKPGKKSAKMVEKDTTLGLVQESEPEKETEDSPLKDPAINEQKRELRKRGRKASASKVVQKEEEDVCFVCFDGGKLILCDKRTCPKAYHVECTGRESEFFEKRGQWFCGWHVCSQCSRPAKLQCYLCPSALCSTCMKGANFWCIRKSRGLCEGCYPLVHMIEHNKTISGEAIHVDFNDKETYEGLFKEYWEEVKLKNSLTSMDFAKACKAKEAGGVPVDGGTNTEQEETVVEEDEGSSDSEDRPPTLRQARLMKRKRLTRHSMVEDASASEFEDDGSDDEVRFESTPKKGRTRAPEFDGWVSKDLAEVIKSLKEDPKKQLPLFGVKKLLWRYVDENKLSNPRRRGQIVCDERLQKLFGKKSVGRFEMMKLLSLHIASPSKLIVPKVGELEHGDNDTVDPDDSDENQLGKKKTRRKMDDNKRLKVHPSDYAAINVKNINLIYLKRSVLDELRNDPELESKAMGAFVRIRVPGTANKNDACYRLVQVVGVKQIYDAHDPEKVTDVILEILNLHKREEITADLVSNQDLVEEECLRLRQSVRCGFIKAMRVGELEERARALREAKVKDWRENELLRLSHLRDRASEKGRKKELRECVEKLQLLNTPEEKERRLKAPFDIDADPHMDPDFESDDEDVPPDDGQGEITASQSLRETGFSARFPDRGNSSGIAEKHDHYRDSGSLVELPSQDIHSKWFAWGSKDFGHEDNAKLRAEMQTQGLNSSSQSPIERSSILGQGKTSWGDGARAREQAGGWNSGSFGRKEVRWTGNVRGNVQGNTGWRKNEGVDAVPKFPSSQEVSAELALGPVLSPIHTSGTTPGSLAGAPPVPMSNTVTMVVDNEKEKVWCYQDPTRTVQGPFTMEQLRKWEKTNLFPLDLRIWRVTESQDASILLSDALAGRLSSRGSHGVPQKLNINNAPLGPMQGTHANGFPVASAPRPTTINPSMGPTMGPMGGNVASGSAQGILANPMVVSQRPNAQSFPLNPMQGLNTHGLPPGLMQGPNTHGFPVGAHAPNVHGFPPVPGQGSNVHSFAPVPSQGPYVNNFAGATQGAAFNPPMQGPNVTGYPPNFTQGPNALPGQPQATVVLPGQPQAPMVFPAQMQGPGVLSGHMQGPHFGNAPLGHAQGAHANNFPMGATPGPVNNTLPPQMGPGVTHGHPGRDFRNMAMPNRPTNEWQEGGRRPMPDQHNAGPASQGMNGSDARAVGTPTRNPWRGQGRVGPRHDNREAHNRGHFGQGQESRGSDHHQGSEGRFVPKNELFCKYYSRGTCRRGPACDFRHQ